MAHHKAVNLNSSTWTAITAPVVCRKILIQEPLLAASANIYVASPTDTSVFQTLPAGTPVELIPTGGNWEVNQPVAQLKLSTGSVTFDQVSQ